MQILLYLNYISFFHNIQKDYLTKLLLKVNNFHKEIEDYLSTNDIEISLKQFNLYDINSSTKSINSNSPTNSIHSSIDSLQNSRFASPNHIRSQYKKIICNTNDSSPKKESEIIKENSPKKESEEKIDNLFVENSKKNNMNNIFFINPMKNKNKKEK